MRIILTHKMSKFFAKKKSAYKRNFLCPREESNFYYKLRKLASYPLNDEGEILLPYQNPASFASVSAVRQM